jgi:hypothetical protein
MKSALFAIAALSLVCGMPAVLQAQTTFSPATTRVMVVPYEEPGSKDPHAAAITQTLVADLQKQGMSAKAGAPMNHLEAVASAAQLCRDNAVTALLIPEGRYEQTRKAIYAYFVTVISYPTHVELRLDEIDCSGAVAWSTAATHDEVRSNVLADPANVGAAIDDAFRGTADDVVTKFAASPPANVLPAVNPPAAVAPASPVEPPAYVVVPFGQPGIADPRSPDLTRSLAKFMTDRKLTVKVIAPIDRLTVVNAAAALCAQNGAGAIMVPDLRLEQVEGRRTHAELRLSVLTCDGRTTQVAFTEHDTANGFMNFNPGAVMVDVTEKAMKPALDQLFSPVAAATPGSGPSR